MRFNVSSEGSSSVYSVPFYDFQNSEIESAKCSIFEDCLQAELVPLTFQEYRRKLIFLQKLVYSNTRDTPDVMKEAPLRYLIGMLYLNLSTMWDPVMTLIATYAVEENKMTFWKVFHEYLALDPSCAGKKAGRGRDTFQLPIYIL